MTIAIHGVDLVAHVAAHAGVPVELASTALTEVLAGLALSLGPPGVELVESELPAELAPALHRRGVVLPLEDRLIGAGVPRGLARELVASVACVLGEELSNDALAAIRAVVSPEHAAWFAPPSPGIVHHAEPRRSSTLAGGKPGSLHPLSEARPRR